MVFNEALAKELLEDRDRDHARFFAGRDEEIRRFDAAVREAGRSEQAVFRVYQGAPGSGKTSLMARLRAIRSDEVLFVNVAKKHLADDGALAGRVRDAAGSTATKIVSTALKSIGSTLRMQPAGDAPGGAVEDKTVEKSRIVLLMDEAQRIDETVQDVLVNLHTIGLGVPAVFLFSGLGHTADRLGNLDGLSRPGDNAIVNVGEMGRDECGESTRMMLEELRVVGTGDEREGLAEMAAKLSFNWPQHLHCAQMAVCRELLRTDGVMREVDADAIRSESDRRRGDYYRGRLRGHPVLENTRYTAAVAAAVRAQNAAAAKDPPEAEPVVGVGQIAVLCRQARDAEPEGSAVLECDIRPIDIAWAMVEKGICTRVPGGPYDVTIPSMADWLDGIRAASGAGRGVADATA